MPIDQSRASSLAGQRFARALSYMDDVRYAFLKKKYYRIMHLTYVYVYVYITPTIYAGDCDVPTRPPRTTTRLRE